MYRLQVSKQNYLQQTSFMQIFPLKHVQGGLVMDLSHFLLLLSPCSVMWVAKPVPAAAAEVCITSDSLRRAYVLF